MDNVQEDSAFIKDKSSIVFFPMSITKCAGKHIIPLWNIVFNAIYDGWISCHSFQCIRFIVEEPLDYKFCPITSTVGEHIINFSSPASGADYQKILHLFRMMFKI